MIPDFVLQIQEISRQLESQSMITRENWQDSVAQRFFDNFVKEYEKRTNQYIYGRSGNNYITGRGLDALLQFYEEKQNEMVQLSGENINSNEITSPIQGVYPERKNWDKSNNGPKPGELNANEVKGVVNQRANNL